MRVEEEIFEVLLKDFSFEEVKMALMEMLNAGIKTYMGYNIEALLAVIGEENGEENVS